MEITVEFTKDTNPLAYSDDQDQNYMYILCCGDYFNSLLRYKGSVTLHDVLERLGYREEKIREMIAEYGNYVWRWRIGDDNFIDIDIDWWRVQLGLDPIIKIDI